MKLSILIPCYNEEEGLPYLYKQLKKVEPELLKEYELEYVFVDDGSTDNTFELLKEFFGKDPRTKIVKHDKNMNLGAALKTGFQHTTGDLILTMDSDCTYPPSQIKEILSLLDDETDIVTASPYHPNGHVQNVPGYRLFLSKTISKIYSVILRKNIYTYTALFRVFRKKILNEINIKSDNFLGVSELLIFSILRGYKIKEFPTTLHSRQHGVSKIRLF